MTTRWTPAMTQKIVALEASLLEEPVAKHFFDLAKDAGFSGNGARMDKRQAGTLSTVLRARGWKKMGVEVPHPQHGDPVMGCRWVAPGLEVGLRRIGA